MAVKQLMTVIGRYKDSPYQIWVSSFRATSARDALEQAWTEVLADNKLRKRDREPDERPQKNHFIEFLTIIPGSVSPLWCVDDGEAK